jgi:hypothetical protein
MTDPGPIRFSHLRAYGRSGLHGFHARFGVEAEPTYAMERGTSVHALLFGTRKVIGYPSVRRGEKFDAFAAEHAAYEILTQNEFDKARRMADAVSENELATQVLDGTWEQTILFDWMGQPCRSTPDCRGASHVAELKTCSLAEPSKFAWHSFRMAYNVQLTFEGLAAAKFGKPILDHFLVAVESAEPFPVTVFRLTERALLDGEKKLMAWMEQLIVCEKSQAWPAYASSIIDLDLPFSDEGIEFEEQGFLSVEEATILGSQA